MRCEFVFQANAAWHFRDPRLNYERFLLDPSMAALTTLGQSCANIALPTVNNAIKREGSNDLAVQSSSFIATSVSRAVSERDFFGEYGSGCVLQQM